MKKSTCILLVLCFSLTAFAKGPGRRYSASLDNSQVVKDQKSQKSTVKNFSSGRRYSTTTGHGFHPFGRKNGGGTSRPESGLGL